MTALGNAEADLRTYLMEHPFVSNKTTSCTVVNGTIAVSTFKVDPWAFRRHTKAIRKHLGKTVEDARVAAKAATAAYNKAKRAAGTARSKASPVDEEDVETLGRLQVQSVAAATCFAEAAAAFAATKKASITDDDVYAADPVLHANLPRGCHEVTFADADGTVVVHIWVKGLRKFTGLLPTDEDDDSGQEEGAAPPPGDACADDVPGGGGKAAQCQLRLPAEATHVYAMDKANGENCKFVVVLVRGEYFVLFGSKNTCHVLRLDSTAEEVAAVLGQEMSSPAACEFPWQNVGGVALRWLRTQDPETLRSLEGVVLCGELMRPWAEHLVCNTYGIELYAVSGDGGVAQDLARTRALFDKVGITPSSGEMRCVTCTVHPAADLDTVVARVRSLKNSEGAVLYAVRRDAEGDHVVELFKVKADAYVRNRRIREIVNAMVRAMQRAPKGVDQEVMQTKTRLVRGMARLTHVPGCAANCVQWGQRAQKFVDYLVFRFLNSTDADSGPAAHGVDAMCAAVRDKFATLLCEFDSSE